MSRQRRLAFQLDFQSGIPAYLQIVRRLERQTLSGRLGAGDQLPTVRHLAGQLGLNFNTVARAYRVLHRLGLVSTQRGRGTYVLGRSAAATARRRQTLRGLAAEYVAQARDCGFADSEIAAMVERRLRLVRRR